MLMADLASIFSLIYELCAYESGANLFSSGSPFLIFNRLAGPNVSAFPATHASPKKRLVNRLNPNQMAAHLIAKSNSAHPLLLSFKQPPGRVPQVAYLHRTFT